MLEWLASRDQFPPVLLLRRYLKLAIEICEERKLMGIPIEQAPELPFALSAIPTTFPRPPELQRWITELA